MTAAWAEPPASVWSVLPGVQHWFSVPQDFLAFCCIAALLIAHPAVAWSLD